MELEKNNTVRPEQRREQVAYGIVRLRSLCDPAVAAGQLGDFLGGGHQTEKGQSKCN